MYVALKNNLVVAIEKDGKLNLDVEYDTIKTFPDDFDNDKTPFDIGWRYEEIVLGQPRCFYPPSPDMLPPPTKKPQVYVAGPDGSPVLVEN